MIVGTKPTIVGTNVPPPPNPQPLGTLHGLSAQINSSEDRISLFLCWDRILLLPACLRNPRSALWLKDEVLSCEGEKVFSNLIPRVPKNQSTFYGFGVVIHKESAFLSPHSGM